ncbi:hypothetical protein F5890DRAFT_1408279 [Lentinula detonsa]|uniref:DUF6533 domain-containing protein n=1 Tax=Lentinula detonsa TaxID=2804962 RepID=A0AA38UVJ6_9AGAR|nr:hypothetical protein F5890DRAFT_1408279 [Lentinula detonsa]
MCSSSVVNSSFSDLYSHSNLQFEIQYASIVLIWYDWILTLPMEVKYIWGSKIRVSTIIYILCHYALLGNILYLFAISHMLKPRASHNYVLFCDLCDTWYKIVGALSILGRAAIMCLVISVLDFVSRIDIGLYTVSFTARAYAVWGRRRVIFAYLASIWIICIGLDIAHVPGLRCVGSSSIPM